MNKRERQDLSTKYKGDRDLHLGVEASRLPYAWRVEGALCDSLSMTNFSQRVQLQRASRNPYMTPFECEHNGVVRGGNHGVWVKVESFSPATSANIDGDVRLFITNDEKNEYGQVLYSRSVRLMRQDKIAQQRPRQRTTW